MSGHQFSRMFADSIFAQYRESSVGIVDVLWQSCCWSVKTVQHNKPHTAKKVRLISGRNSPDYSVGISDPRADIQATGQAVLDIYNQRIEKVRGDYADIRLIVLIRNMQRQEYTIFERAISKLVVNNYHWQTNSRDNFEGYEDGSRIFTWQPHGAQFTIHEPIPTGATRFRITKKPEVLEIKDVLKFVRFAVDWVEILPEL